MTSNSTTLLRISKWCFLVVALWYSLVCIDTWYDPEIYVEFFDSTYTMWHVRAFLALVSMMALVLCEVADVE